MFTPRVEIFTPRFKYLQLYGTPGWTLIVRVFIVVRNKKNHVQKIYFMVEKFEIKAIFLIQR